MCIKEFIMDSTEVSRGADGGKRRITNICIGEYHDIVRGPTKRIRLFVGNEDKKIVSDIAKTSIISLLQKASKETICGATIDGETVEIAPLTTMRAGSNNSNMVSGDQMSQIMKELKETQKQNIEILERQENLETMNKAMLESQKAMENQMNDNHKKSADDESSQNSTNANREQSDEQQW